MSDAPLKILLVEDNPADARILRELLSETGPVGAFELTHELRLAPALERLSRGGFDVVLLDLSLPDVNGLDTVSRSLAAAPDVPIVILSGLDDSRLALEAVQRGAQDYLVKGAVTGHLLVRALRYAIERKRAEESARRLFREQAIRAQAEASERRFRFLAEASRALAGSLDFETTLQTVAKLAVPNLCDLCMVDLIDEAGEIRRIASAHTTRIPESLALAARQHAPRTSRANSPPIRAIMTREPVLEGRITEEMMQAWALDQAHLELMRSLEPQSLLAVPLIARDRVLGALQCIFTSSGRRHDWEDVVVASDLAARAALAIENARLFSEAQQMIGVVSHDLRNPLNVIVMAVGGLRRHPQAEDGALRLLQKIDLSAQRMTHLIQDLLDVSRMEAGGLSLALEPQEVEPLIADVLEQFRPLAEEKSLVLEAEVEPALPPIQANRERILQVFSNLIGNAIKFTPEGGGITIGAGRRPEGVRFWVRDTGPGIAPEALPRLFDRFWQAMRNDRQGAGLGLAIAKGLVQAHRGRIWVESRLQWGSTFYFLIPTSSPEQVLQGAPANEPAPTIRALAQ